MSHAHGEAHFADGTVFHFEYNGTTDVVCSALRLTSAEVDAHWRADNTADCTCGKSSEPCRLGTYYGGGFHWPGRACRGCMAVTDGFFPYDLMDRGLIDGWPPQISNLSVDVGVSPAGFPKPAPADSGAGGGSGTL